jgi:hypothetical protein
MVLPVQHSHGFVSGCEPETAVRLGFDSKLRTRVTAHKWTGLNISETFSGLEIKRLRVPDKGPVSGKATSQALESVFPKVSRHQQFNVLLISIGRP